MRDIIFRGKRVDSGEWVEGMTLQHGRDTDGWHKKHTFLTPCDESFPLEVDDSAVGQYTGLTDRNGKRIFEGDIVHCVSRTDSGNMVVIFEDGEFRMVLCENYNRYVTGGGFYALRCFDKEIIGNIHDNPELLK